MYIGYKLFLPLVLYYTESPELKVSFLVLWTVETKSVGPGVKGEPGAIPKGVLLNWFKRRAFVGNFLLILSLENTLSFLDFFIKFDELLRLAFF